MPRVRHDILLDCKIPSLTIPANRLVDPTIGPTTDETYDSVSVSNADLVFVDHGRHFMF